MKPFLTLFLAASLLAGSPLVAQARMAQPVAPEARKAAVSNLFEIQSSRLALQRSRNPNVRRFAKRMIADHTALAARMNAMLARNGMGPPPPVLDSAHRYLLRQLATTPAPAFDRAYLSQQLNAHVQAVNLLSRYERRGAIPFGGPRRRMLSRSSSSISPWSGRWSGEGSCRRRAGMGGTADRFEKRGQHRQILGSPLPDRPFFSRLRQRARPATPCVPFGELK